MNTISLIFLIISILRIFGAISASNFYVQDLPGVPSTSNIKLHAGHITLDDNYGSSFFFALARNKYIINKQRTLIWLNGGPGCSSLDGFFLENGPLLMTATGAFKENPGAWNEFANLVAVDQPVGTGYSYSTSKDGPKGLAETAEAFVAFLDEFFKKFPEYRHDDLYISGESFAGQYIPYIASTILKRNKNQPSKHYNLKGLLMGNAWISPSIHYNSYLSFSLENKLLVKGTEQYQTFLKTLEKCQKAVDSADKDNYDLCNDLVGNIVLPGYTSDKKCINLYDYRLREEDCGTPWPDGVDQLEIYLNQTSVLRAFNIDLSQNLRWKECSGKVYHRFIKNPSPPSIHLLPDLLKEIPILLYSGDKDIICNHRGTERIIESLEWNGRKGFVLENGSPVPTYNWVFMDKVVGTYQFDRNLTYVLVKDASHMVPYDQPLVAQDMLNRFFELDPNVILEVRKFNAKMTNFSMPIVPGGSLEDVIKLRKEKTAWVIYYHVLVFVLFLVIIGAVYCAWRCFRNSRASPPTTEKYGNADHPTYLENGVPYDNKEYANVYQPRTDYQSYDPSVMVPYSDHQPYSDTKKNEDPMPGYSHSSRVP